jgi:HEPN domain-containing protein
MSNDAIINGYANSAFRDIADQDYIAARTSYRAELWEPFLWSSQQAFEKLLKGILLFNEKSSKKISHDLSKALDKVKSIDQLNFNIPQDVEEFIIYLNNFGKNRYLETTLIVYPDALPLLDKAYWFVRRFCQNMHEKKVKSDGKVVDLYPANVSRVNSQYYLDNPHKLYLFGGKLEKILQNKKNPFKKLIWQNFYYGSRKKNVIKNYTTHSVTINSLLSIHQNSYNILKNYIHFSKLVKDIYEQPNP